MTEQYNLDDMSQMEIEALVGKLYMHMEGLNAQAAQIQQNIEACKSHLLQLRAEAADVQESEEG
jgi:predicted sulfurtransferase